MIRPTIIPGFRFEHSCPGAWSAPGKRQNAVDLWRVARFAHEHFSALIIDAEDLAKRRTMGFTERRGLLMWLEPIEKLVKALLVIRAITYLVMTVEGRRLLRESPKMPWPKKPEPPGKTQPAPSNNNHVISIPYPGWRTIAANRVSALEVEKALEARLAAQPSPATHSNKPSDWSCSFRVLSPDYAEPLNEEWFPPSATKNPRSLILDFSRDPDIAHAQHLQRKAAEAEAPHRPEPPRPTGCAIALNLARRLEALGRVLANPEPHVMRLARFIARIPHGALGREAPPVATTPWSQLKDEYKDAVALMLCAIGAYYRVLECG